MENTVKVPGSPHSGRGSFKLIKRFRRGPGKPTIFSGMDLANANRVASSLNKERRKHDQFWFVVEVE